MKKYRRYITLLLIILFLTGCKSEKEEETQIQKKDKAPSSLSDFSQGLQEILNDVEKIEKILDGTYIEMNEGTDQETEEGTDQETDQETEEGTDEKTEEGKDQETDEEEEKEIKLLESWTNIDRKIEDIHNQWDIYGVEGNKKGISTSIRDELEEKLNSLTKSIEERDITDVYEYGSQTMLELEPVFNLYKDEIKGSTNKIKYYTYQSYLNVMEGRKTKGQNLLEDLTGDLNQIRIKLEKDEEKIKILDKLNLSIESMKVALKQDSIKLYRIKKDIIIENINELEK